MKNRLKYFIGLTAERLMPQLAGEVAAGRLNGSNSRLRKLVAAAQTRRAAESGDFESLRQKLANYWTSTPGDEFYGAYPERFDEWFLGEHFVIFEELKKLLEKRGDFNQLIEVGCGDGKVLEYLVNYLPMLDRFVGLDINPGIIAANQKSFAENEQMTFVASDLVQWLDQNAAPGLVLLSYGGVLEYLTGEELKMLFGTLRKKASPVIIALVEPLTNDFDLANETESRPGGVEFSFSHPHRHLLESEGWRIEFVEEKWVDHRWVLLIAES